MREVSKLESTIQNLGGELPKEEEVVSSSDDMDGDEPATAASDEVEFPPLYVGGENFDAAADAKQNAADLKSQGKWEKALEEYTRAVLSAEPSPLLYANRAIALLQLDRPKAAERDCNQALVLNPDSAKGLRVRGKARLAMQEWETARHDLSEAQQIDFDEGTVEDLKNVSEKCMDMERERAKENVKEEDRLRNKARGGRQKKRRQNKLNRNRRSGALFAPTSPLSMSTPPIMGHSSFKPAKPPTPARPPPIPRGPLKPEEVLESILKDFAKATQASTDRVAQLRQQRDKLFEEKTAATTKELFVSQQISNAEAQQGAAAELEDFDLADRLGAVIEIHSIEKREQTIILRNIGRALSMLDEQRDSVVGAVASCFAQVHTQLETLAQKQERKDKKDDSDCMRRYTNTAQQLSAENERLLKDLKHVERDEELFSEEKGEFESAIGEQTATLVENRDEANDKLQRVKEEIAGLKKEMREKETVAADLKADVDQVESAIAKVIKNFSRQAARVQNKEAAVKEYRKEWKGERARYERDKECHDEEVKTHSEDLLKHDEIMLRLKTEMNNASVFKEIVEAGDVVVYESTSAGNIGMSPEDGERTELDDLHENVVEGEAALLEANHVLKAANIALVSLRQEHEELFERIPLLEAEKKDAATRRDFKAAGKVSKEIKDLTARLKECEADLNGDPTANVKKSKATLESLQKGLDTKKERMHEKQKEQGSSAMRDLATTIKRLKSCKIKLCSASTGLNVLVVGASVLDCQINTLRKEGEVYDAKYGGWEQTLTEIVGETFDDQIDNENRALHSDSETVEDSKSGKSTQDEGVSSKRAVSESRDVKIEKFRNVMGKLKEAEDALEAAVAIEDIDQAAELDEAFQQLQTDLVALGLTDEDMEIAISDDAVKENDDSTLCRAATVAAQPAFSFGAAAAAPVAAVPVVVAAQPSFSFGAAPVAAVPAAAPTQPGFSFGTAPAAAAPPVSNFGGTANTIPSAAPFTNAATPAPSIPAPSMSFGSAPAPPAAAPAFAFGAAAPVPPPATGGFGSTPAAPVMGGFAPAQAAPPAAGFSFGASAAPFPPANAGGGFGNFGGPTATPVAAAPGGFGGSAGFGAAAPSAGFAGNAAPMSGMPGGGGGLSIGTGSTSATIGEWCIVRAKLPAGARTPGAHA